MMLSPSPLALVGEEEAGRHGKREGGSIQERRKMLGQLIHCSGRGGIGIYTPAEAPALGERCWASIHPLQQAPGEAFAVAHERRLLCVIATASPLQELPFSFLGVQRFHGAAPTLHDRGLAPSAVSGPSVLALQGTAAHSSHQPHRLGGLCRIKHWIFPSVSGSS